VLYQGRKTQFDLHHQNLNFHQKYKYCHDGFQRALDAGVADQWCSFTELALKMNEPSLLKSTCTAVTLTTDENLYFLQQTCTFATRGGFRQISPIFEVENFEV
jgi:hypothetical protein